MSFWRKCPLNEPQGAQPLTDASFPGLDAAGPRWHCRAAGLQAACYTVLARAGDTGLGLDWIEVRRLAEGLCPVCSAWRDLGSYHRALAMIGRGCRGKLERKDRSENEQKRSVRTGSTGWSSPGTDVITNLN